MFAQILGETTCGIDGVLFYGFADIVVVSLSHIKSFIFIRLVMFRQN